MKKFEYCCKDVVNTSPDWSFDEMGLNGWELCTISETPKGYRYIFKREKCMTREEIIKAAQAYYPSGILHEEAKVSAFVRGAEWADKTMLDRACEWLKNGGYFVNSNETIEDFRKAMEGGAE